MSKDIGIPNDVKRYEITEKDLDALTNAAMKVTRLLSNNPKEITHDDAKSIYTKLI